MSSRPRSNETNALPRWITPGGIDLSLYPIDGVLRQALSSTDDEFRSGCTLLKSMCGTGRLEAGAFLLGLLSRNAANYSRLTQIADALAAYPSPETVSAFSAELRRVRGSSATRAYLRRIVEALGAFPPQLTEEAIFSLSTDPLVGVRFRQRLTALLKSDDPW